MPATDYGGARMTGMQIFCVIVVIGALVAFFFAIKAQMRRGDTLAGPVTPSDMDEPQGGESATADYHKGEGEGEKVADEYETITNTLGHG